MTPRALAALAAFLLLPAAVASAGADPAAFARTAPLLGEFAPGTPAGVELPPAVLAASAADLSDLRLLDREGRETPFVLYARTVPAAEETTTFSFAVAGFSTTDEGDAYIIEDPEPGRTIHGLEVITPTHDFSRTVRVFVPQPGGWREIASDAVFDFSSRAPLRKTSIALPPTAAPRLRLLMRDTGAGGRDEASLEVRFRGVEVTMREGRSYPPTTGTFRLTGAMGRERTTRTRRAVEDRVPLPPSPPETDAEGNTVLRLGEVGLPLTALTLAVETAFFYREVEVWEDPPEEAKGKGQAPRLLGSGLIYRVPGMERGQDAIRLPGRKAGQVRLVVRNGDNPPLSVAGVEGTVPRRWLWFLPEAGKGYALYFGGKGVRPPRYETPRLIPDDPERLEKYPLLKTGAVGGNPSYRRDGGGGGWEWTRTALFAVVAAAALALLAWVVALLKKVREGKA